MVSINRDEARAIEWDCAKLLTKFYMYLDEKRYEELGALFSERGVWVRRGQELVGPKNIIAAMSERKGWLTAHLVSNIGIDVIDSDNVETSQYVTLYRHEGWRKHDGPGPMTRPQAILHHRDALVRVDASWKFRRKTSRPIMSSGAGADRSATKKQ